MVRKWLFPYRTCVGDIPHPKARLLIEVYPLSLKANNLKKLAINISSKRERDTNYAPFPFQCINLTFSPSGKRMPPLRTVFSISAKASLY